MIKDILSGFQRTKLDPVQPYKPLDFGGGGISGSLNRDGRIIAVNVPHSRYGYITLSAAPPFSEHARYDPAAVRAYRRSMADLNGYGVAFNRAIVQREAWLIEDSVPFIRLTLEGGASAECITLVSSGEYPYVVQYWEFFGPTTDHTFSGNAWLMRCAYTQLTEGGPAAMPDSRAALLSESSNDGATACNPALPAYAQLHMPGLRISIGDGGSIDFTTHAEATRLTSSTCIVIALSENRLPQIALDTASIPVIVRDGLIDCQKVHTAIHIDTHPLQLPITRGLTYSRNCCIPTGDDAVCIITDHMLLPLAWNRDAYYAACALLQVGDEMQPVIRGHLIWLFERAERIDGLWGRSYLVNGRVKDRGYQLDQQLYPLLELADYVLLTADMALYDRLKQHIQPLLDRLFATARDIAWLLPTDETPGDDPIMLPYHLSSHILLWRTLTQLARLPDMESLVDAAGALKSVILEHFVTHQNENALFSYAADAKGQHHLYHDANDVPLVLAPHWGFTAADDSIWRNTIVFAFSEANEGGYYAGRLGSVHTPAAWPLGDIQEYVVANITDDTERAQRAMDQIRRAMQWDGALPEAYDPADCSVVSRHWFVWPNALLAWWELSKGSA